MKNTFLKRVSDFLSLIKFSHTIFAMPFAVIGFFLAVSNGDYDFSIRLFVLVILCMIFARSAAMAFNRYADNHYDSLNPRTEKREIPSGTISRGQVLVFVIISSVLFIITTAFINRLTLLLSPLALAIVLGYSFTKRFTNLCHFILGLGLSLAPIGAYIAVSGSFDLLPLVYSAIVLTWVGGFDIIYSLQDDEFDREHKLYSIPANAGRKKALTLSVLSHSVTAILVIAAGISGGGGPLYWAGAVIFISLLVMQHRMVKHDDLSKVTVAFATTNGIAGLLFGLLVVADILMV